MRPAPDREVAAAPGSRRAFERLAGSILTGPVDLPGCDRDIARRLLAWLREDARCAEPGFAEPPRRLEGGLDTRNFRFRLAGASPGFEGPLVLRLYTRQHSKRRVLTESAIQSVLADRSLPVAPVRRVCIDPSPLGGPFFVMDCLPGEPMRPLDQDHVRLLGRSHAALHREASEPVAAALRDLGRWRPRFQLPGEIEKLLERARPHRALLPTVEWLGENMPPEPMRLAICHGDYHPLNILVRDGAVTGILDWPDFKLADPLLDVASTLVVCRAARHFLGVRAADSASDTYLDAYREYSQVEQSTLDYFTVRRCIVALLDGAYGRKIWRHPPIVADLAAEILRITGRAPADLPRATRSGSNV